MDDQVQLALVNPGENLDVDHTSPVVLSHQDVAKCN
jgi:hypothetical protein